MDQTIIQEIIAGLVGIAGLVAGYFIREFIKRVEENEKYSRIVSKLSVFEDKEVPKVLEILRALKDASSTIDGIEIVEESEVDTDEDTAAK